MTKPVVIDTNVVVAGLITSNEESPVCRILDSMLCGRFAFVLSNTLLDEYRRVMLRDAIRNLHGLSPNQVDVILTEIVTNAIIRDPGVASQTAPDPGDNHLWDLLRHTKNAMLVTGDRKLIDNPPRFASVVSPRSFVQVLDQS